MTSALTRACRKAVRPVRQKFFPPPVDISSDRGRAILTRLTPRPLVLIAHPDDEVFCSGLLLHLAANCDAEITLACATRGEGGGSGHLNAEELGDIRTIELEDAAAELGVASTEFLGFPDPPGEEPAFHTGRSELIPAFDSLVTRTGPSVIITHGSSGEYWHPAHIALHEVAMIQAKTIPVLTFNAWQSSHPLSHLLNKDDAAHLVLDTKPFAEARHRALQHHQSQADVFERFASGSLADFISKSRFEAYRLHGMRL